MMAGLAKAPCTYTGRTTPVISRTAAPVRATTSGRILSQIKADTTAARTRSVRIWSTLIGRPVARSENALGDRTLNLPAPRQSRRLQRSGGRGVICLSSAHGRAKPTEQPPRPCLRPGRRNRGRRGRFPAGTRRFGAAAGRGRTPGRRPSAETRAGTRVERRSRPYRADRSCRGGGRLGGRGKRPRP